MAPWTWIHDNVDKTYHSPSSLSLPLIAESREWKDGGDTVRPTICGSLMVQ